MQAKCASCEGEEEKKLQQKGDSGGDWNKLPVAEEPEEKEEIQTKADATVQACACEEKEEPVQMKVETSVQAKADNTVQACAACDAKEEELQRKPGFESEEERVQACACEEKEEPVRMKVETSIQTKAENAVQSCSACDAKEENVQRKESIGSPSTDVEGSLNQSKGGGSSMSPQLRQGMESAFGADFSGVKIHTGNTAVEMSKSLNAQAFTHGNDIYFNSNKFSPDTNQGQKLLAHELTHTIQQGSSSAVVNRSSLVQRDCETPEESPPAAAAEEASTTIDHAPCAVTNPPAEEPPEGTEEPSEEERPAAVEANEGAPVGERQANAPAADANAPDREEGVAEGASEEAPAQDPCALREAAAGGGAGGAAAAGGSTGAVAGGSGATGGSAAAGGARAGSGGGAGSTGAGSATGSGRSSASEGGTGTTAAGGGAGASTSGAGSAAAGSAGAGRSSSAGRNEEGGNPETGFLSAVIARGISSNIVAEGLGEAASPELQTSRDEQFGEESNALLTLDTTRNSVLNLTNAGTGFMPVPVDSSQSKEMREATVRRHARSSIQANEFLRNAGAQLEDLITRAQDSAADLQQKRIADRAQLEADIQSRRDETRGAYSAMRGRANARAAATQLVIDARYAQTVVQIEVKAVMSNLLLMISNIGAVSQLATAKVNQLTALDGVYNTAYNNLKAVGVEVGQDAESRAAQHSRAYQNADGVQDPEIVSRVRNREKDGFWDGYLTYNRYKARAESATEVGKQYKEGMEKEGQKQADNMMCGKSVDLEVVNSISDSGSSTLQCTYDNAKDNIQLQRQAALAQALVTKQELGNAVQSSLQATIIQLREREASNLQLINDYGIRQAMAIERDTATSISSMLKGVNQAATHLSGILNQFSLQVKTTDAPDPLVLTDKLRVLQSQFSLALTGAGSAMDTANNSSANILSTGLAHTQAAIQQLSADGISGGWELASGFSSTMTSMVSSTGTVFDELWTNLSTAMQATTDQGVAQINGVVTAITGLYTQMNANLTARFEESASHMRSGMTNSLNQDFDSKICAEAEKAAAEVQPWWKTVLKVLLVIVVIVVVALVIGPAVIGAVGALAASMAGAVGVGAALAGTIGTWVGAIVGGAIVGALSGLTIQVGNNLIDMIGNGPFSWDRATRGWRQAIIAGAIGGALGGLGGQLGQLLVGRLATAGISTGWQLVAEFGINMAFDTVGGILGDLANGNPITLEGVLQGAVIGAVVQLSFVGIGRMARSGEAGREAGRTLTRMERLAMGIEGIQKGSMGFGENLGGGLGARMGGPSGEWSRNALAAAREAMAPRRPQSGTNEEPNTTARGGSEEATTDTTGSGTRPADETTSSPRPAEDTGTPTTTEETSTPRATEDSNAPRPAEDTNVRPSEGTTPQDASITRPGEETTTSRPGEETAAPRPGEEASSGTRAGEEPANARPDEPTSRPSEETDGLVKSDDLENGIAAERELPNGHKERINEHLDPEGCSSCDLLKRRYSDMFRRGQLDMDEASFNGLMGEIDQVKADLINTHGDAILDPPTALNRGDMINGRTRQSIYDEYLGRITEIEGRILPSVKNRTLVVGEATFEYTNALTEKLTRPAGEPNPTGTQQDITATGYESRAHVEQMNAERGLPAPPPEGGTVIENGPSLTIEHNIDATNLAANYPPNSFDRMVFNNPEVPGDEALVNGLLEGVLSNAPNVLRPNAEIQIGLTGSARAKGRIYLDGLVAGAGGSPRVGANPVEVTINGRRYQVRIVETSNFSAPYNARRTEGGRLRTSTGPSRYYVFKLL
ncbi:MAG: Rossmann-like fold-containing protein [Pseudobacter sp.]|uniref:Rossmann-like fold-containing protein n=1 Tax=Pseudobacter sp. TaxID=2045420 RepID=UPI003F8099BF